VRIATGEAQRNPWNAAEFDLASSRDAEK